MTTEFVATPLEAKPTKLHQILQLALEDVKHLSARKDVRIDMDSWLQLEPLSNGGHRCLMCLAGAFLVSHIDRAAQLCNAGPGDLLNAVLFCTSRDVINGSSDVVQVSGQHLTDTERDWFIDTACILNSLRLGAVRTAHLTMYNKPLPEAVAEEVDEWHRNDHTVHHHSVHQAWFEGMKKLLKLLERHDI